MYAFSLGKGVGKVCLCFTISLDFFNFFSCLFSFSFRNRSRGKLFDRQFFFFFFFFWPEMGCAGYLHLCTKFQQGNTHTYTHTQNKQQQEANRQTKVTLCSRNSFIITWTVHCYVRRTVEFSCNRAVLMRITTPVYYFIASLVIVCFPVAR